MIYDITSIGSAGVDVFVKAKHNQKKHHNHIDVCYPLGSKIIVDKLIFTTGGGGSNTAVSFSRLGLKTAFIGLRGKDINSKLILDELKKEKVDFLGNIKEGHTGYSVVLAGDRDRTILVSKGLNNGLSFEELKLKNWETRWLFISAMLEKSFKTSLKLIELSKKKGSKIALNMGPYLAKKGLKRLSRILRNSDLLFLNNEEGIELTSKNNPQEMFEVLKKYTNGTIIITNGPNRIYVQSDNQIFTRLPNKIKPIDSTGAGDAFSSAFTYSIIMGKSIPECILAGLKNSQSVIRKIGAKNGLQRKL
jgi:ribokinase